MFVVYSGPRIFSPRLHARIPHTHSPHATRTPHSNPEYHKPRLTCPPPRLNSQPLLRNLNLPPPGTTLDEAIVGASLVALSCLLCRLLSHYLPFVLPVRRKLQSLREHHLHLVPKECVSEYESLVETLLKGQLLPREPPGAVTIEIRSSERMTARVKNARQAPSAGGVNMQALETAWALSGRTTASDIRDWMRRLSIEFLRQSPSPILQQCAALAKFHQPLSNQLLNVSFMSLWDDSFALDPSIVIESNQLIDNLELALRYD